MAAALGMACTTEVVELRARDASLAGDSETAGELDIAYERDAAGEADWVEVAEAREDAAIADTCDSAADVPDGAADVPDSAGDVLDGAADERDSPADVLNSVERPAWGEAGNLPDSVSLSATGLARYVQYSCCRSDRVTGCLVGVLGGPTSCKAAAIWKAYADQACRQQGLSMTDVSFYGDCTDLSNGTDGGVDAPCITLENHDSRCTICDEATASSNFYCEPLVCKPYVDGGTVCQECVWADHPGEPCTYCVDASGALLKDTCHTLASAS